MDDINHARDEFAGEENLAGADEATVLKEVRQMREEFAVGHGVPDDGFQTYVPEATVLNIFGPVSNPYAVLCGWDHGGVQIVGRLHYRDLLEDTARQLLRKLTRGTKLYHLFVFDVSPGTNGGVRRHLRQLENYLVPSEFLNANAQPDKLLLEAHPQDIPISWSWGLPEEKFPP